ncbi:MAG: hypothetical protein QNJ46_23765 [Leptolyngbyaceae cyanobacterium MO_188.B28]|nr:hypothetical protein [Leptolyngbyaceae cyanobacterium MO_188.B28]
MNVRRNLLHSFISLSLLLAGAASPALGGQTPESISSQPAQFRNIEKPLLRIGLSLGGVAMIGILLSSVIEGVEGESIIRNQDQTPW